MKWQVASDSVVSHMCADGGHPRFRWLPIALLMWTVWIFINPVLNHQSGWLWPTLASFPVFLLLYLQAWYGPRRWFLWCTLGIAALAFALTPINVGGFGYLIYASCFIVFTGSTLKVGFKRVLSLNALFAAECMALNWPVVFVISVPAMSAAIGCSNLFYRRDRERDAELNLSHDEIRRLAATAERERIGRDLHDLLGHTLSLVALKSELAARLVEHDPRRARTEIEDVGCAAREALSQVRRAVAGIRAAMLASELASARLMMETAGVHMNYRSDVDGLPDEVENCLALVLREAVTNIERHAHAGHVDVAVDRTSGQVHMQIRDDGRGGVSRRGNGLTGMRERVQALDGKLSVDSPRGRGTAIEVTLPLVRATSRPQSVHPAPVHQPALALSATDAEIRA